jgi:hypothetical protein
MGESVLKFYGTLRKEVQMAKGKSVKIGRDAGTGKFIPVNVAKIRKSTATVETNKHK